MNVLDFTIKNLARSLLFALLAQQACLEAEQGKYLCEGKFSGTGGFRIQECVLVH